MRDERQQDEEAAKRGLPRQDGWLVRLVCIVISLTSVGGLIWGTFWLFGSIEGQWLDQRWEDRGPVMVGIPVATCLATGVTSAARAMEGNMGIDLLGVRAQGGVATGALWLAVFLVVVFSVRWLW